MAGNRKVPSPAPGGDKQVQDFLDKIARTPAIRRPDEVGRLIFAMDATASREPTWDRASQIQGEMFAETAALGGLRIQLAYYRGFGEFEATGWYGESKPLLERMTSVMCRAGRTQIAKVLKHARKEAQARRVNALVFVGDCMEEDIDALGQLAGELGLLGVPCFMFHEGGEPIARRAFEQIASLSGGACCRFDANSPQQLRDLLKAVAVFAAGGRKALADYSRKRGGVVKQLTHQVK